MTTNESSTWGRRIYERHLDLLLAEELACRPAFARWMLDKCISEDPLPDGDPAEVVVEVSDDDDIGDDVEAAGENDLFMEARWTDGSRVRLLIEDKLDAVVQHRQGERYGLRIDLHRQHSGVTAAGGAAVAPTGYLERHRGELKPLKPVSIEEIADRLTGDAQAANLDPEIARRLRWRADRLVSMKETTRIPTPDDPQTIKVRDWIIARLNEVEPAARPNAVSMRTKGSGWLYFDEPACLVYKLYHGYVDVYLRDIWPDDPGQQTRMHESGDFPDGFEADLDTKKNLILRASVHRQMRSAGADLSDHDDVAALKRGVIACAAATRWAQRTREISGPES